MATWWIIPARKGSKELPGKNHRLVPLLLAGLPAVWRDHTVLTTDDDVLAAQNNTVLTIKRPAELATDTASMRGVLRHFVSYFGVARDTLLVVLYPTFPCIEHRGIAQGITKVLAGAPLALGRMPVLEHPYRMFVAGEPLTPTGVYRRQDYPAAWSICHAVCVMRASTLDTVDDNLWCPGVEWVDIQRQIDVDSQCDMDKLLGDS